MHLRLWFNRGMKICLEAFPWIFWTIVKIKITFFPEQYKPKKLTVFPLNLRFTYFYWACFINLCGPQDGILNAYVDINKLCDLMPFWACVSFFYLSWDTLSFLHARWTFLKIARCLNPAMYIGEICPFDLYFIDFHPNFLISFLLQTLGFHSSFSDSPDQESGYLVGLRFSFFRDVGICHCEPASQSCFGCIASVGWVPFLFSFVSSYFWISLLISSLMRCLFIACCSISTYPWIFQWSSCYCFLASYHVVRQESQYSFFHVLRLDLWPSMWSALENVPWGSHWFWMECSVCVF